MFSYEQSLAKSHFFADMKGGRGNSKWEITMLSWEEPRARLEDICRDVIGGEEALPMHWHHFLRLPACPGRLRGCSGNAVREPGCMRHRNTAGLLPSGLARSFGNTVLQPNADDEPEGRKDCKTGQQVASFCSCLYGFKMEHACHRGTEKLLQRPCEALRMDTQTACPTQPPRDGFALHRLLGDPV